MTDKSKHAHILSILQRSQKPLSLPEISKLTGSTIPERTLRRWLVRWVDEGTILRSGNKRSTRYQFKSTKKSGLKFLHGLTDQQKKIVLSQLRDLWTHTSTAVEGNTLTLGDTHFVLEDGLTISGKPIKDHQEVIGHARAIDLIYQHTNQPLSEAFVFALHKAIQAENIVDIYKPQGAWKIEPNGTYVVTRQEKQVYIDYALPAEVPALMQEIMDFANTLPIEKIDFTNAHEYYALIHAGIAHVHPFWDGNGRIARLIANIPVLKAGFPPIIIPTESRRIYIQLLAEYQLTIGQINGKSGVWPNTHTLTEFTEFCKSCYEKTKHIVASIYKTE